MDLHPSGRPASCAVARAATPRALLVVGAFSLALLACSGSSDYAPIDEAVADGDGSSDVADGGGAVTGDFTDPGEVEGFEPVVYDEAEPVDRAEQGTTLASGTVDEVIEDVAAEIETRTDGDEPAGELLASVAPIDEAAEPVTDRDGRTRNEVGELALLDEQASLACANVEIAVGALDEGREGEAADHLDAAAEHAAASAVGGLPAWSGPLSSIVAGADGGDDLATMIGFLSVCTDGGYEL